MRHTVETYLSELEARLNPLPGEKRKEIIREYRSHFEAAAAEGVSERSSIKSLKNPLRLSDSILETHQVFSRYQKLQVRYLKFFCLVVAAFSAYLAFGLGRNWELGEYKAALLLGAATLWGLACLPYYVCTARSRKFLFKPFIVATLSIWGMFSLGQHIIVTRRLSEMLVPYRQKIWTKDEALHIQEGQLAIQRVINNGTESPADFRRSYANNRPDLIRLASQLDLRNADGGYLIPHGRNGHNPWIQFSTTSNLEEAFQRWRSEQTALQEFAGNASGMASGYNTGLLPYRWYQSITSGQSRFLTVYLVAPLGAIAFCLGNFRPIVRRRRGVA